MKVAVIIAHQDVCPWITEMRDIFPIGSLVTGEFEPNEEEGEAFLLQNLPEQRPFYIPPCNLEILGDL